MRPSDHEILSTDADLIEHYKWSSICSWPHLFILFSCQYASLPHPPANHWAMIPIQPVHQYTPLAFPFPCILQGLQSIAALLGLRGGLGELYKERGWQASAQRGDLDSCLALGVPLVTADSGLLG